MKVLFLTTHLNLGGISSYLLTLTKELHRAGCQVVIASSGGRMVEQFEDVGAQHIPLNIKTKSELNPKLYFALFRLRRIIKKENIEIIHAHTRITQVMGQLLKYLTGAPYVSTCHGFYKRRLSRKWVPCWGDAVVAISPAVQKHLKDDFKVNEDKVHLIPNGIDVEQFPNANQELKSEKRHQFNLNGHLVIGIIARLADVKGHDVLIAAMPKVIKTYPKAKLMIVGQGKMEEHLRSLVSKLELENYVLFYPVITKTSEILPLFDIFVMPSLDEGFGLSVIEAQACGLPVIASRVGGLASIIKNGETGVLVSPGNSEELGQAIVDLLNKPEYAQMLGQQARVDVEERFSSKRLIKQVSDIYTKLIQKR